MNWRCKSAETIATNRVHFKRQNSNGLQWITMDYNGLQWIAMDCNGFVGDKSDRELCARRHQGGDSDIHLSFRTETCTSPVTRVPSHSVTNLFG